MKHLWISALSLTAVLAACKSHLSFVEESHVGLKAKIAANQTNPFDVDLGYRRGMLVFLPKKGGAEDEQASAVRSVTTVDDGTGNVTEKVSWKVYENPSELMSLYTRFDANVGFNAPVKIKHFLATGTAAALLMTNEEQLRKLSAASGAKEAEGNTP